MSVSVILTDWADEIMLFSRVESAKKSAPESAPETNAKCYKVLQIRAQSAKSAEKILENFRLKNTYKLRANVCKHLEHPWMRAILHFTSGHCRHHHRASQDSIQNHIRITELIESAKLHDRISEESVGTGTCTCTVYTVQYSCILRDAGTLIS